MANSDVSKAEFVEDGELPKISRDRQRRRHYALWADVHRRRNRSGWLLLVRAMARDRTFRPIFTLRLYQKLRRIPGGRLVTPIISQLHRHFCVRASMDFPITLSVGPGLLLQHGWGMVINPWAKIGSNVTILHGVTIGQADRISRDGHRIPGYPTIGDNIWIGPNAAIVGDVTIGSGSRILAGAIVTSDVPPHSMVSGNPAQIIKTDCVTDVLHPAPLIQDAIVHNMLQAPADRPAV